MDAQSRWGWSCRNGMGGCYGGEQGWRVKFGSRRTLFFGGGARCCGAPFSQRSEPATACHVQVGCKLKNRILLMSFRTALMASLFKLRSQELFPSMLWTSLGGAVNLDSSCTWTISTMLAIHTSSWLTLLASSLAPCWDDRDSWEDGFSWSSGIDTLPYAPLYITCFHQ